MPNPAQEASLQAMAANIHRTGQAQGGTGDLGQRRLGFMGVDHQTEAAHAEEDGWC